MLHYTRLKITKNLIKEDGVIFISIGDEEVNNLKMLCNEVFGENQFITTIHIQMSSVQGQKVKAAKEGNIVKNSENILVYGGSNSKRIVKNVLYDAAPYDTHYSIYLEKDGDDYIEKPLSEILVKKTNTSVILKRLGLMENNRITIKNIAKAYNMDDDFKYCIHNLSDNIASDDKVTTLKIPNENEIIFGIVKKVQLNNRQYLLTRNSKGNLRQRIRLRDKINQAHDFANTYGCTNIRGDWWSEFYKDMGNVSKEGDMPFPNGKKPIRLLKQLIFMIGSENEIILDFFAGSSSTAHAVIQLNSEDAGKRKFIMVQLPEPCDEKSEAYEAGYKTIAEIGKERIRRAGELIKVEKGDELGFSDLDIGFRVFKVDSSNMKDVYYGASEYDQQMLGEFESNIKEDRTDIDLLYGVLLDWGLPLSLKHNVIDIEGVTIHIVDEDSKHGISLVACFEEAVSESVIRQIAKKVPLRAVFRDNSFQSSSEKINVTEIFKLISPNTTVKVI